MENTREIKNLPVLIKCFAILKISSCSPSFNTRIHESKNFSKWKSFDAVNNKASIPSFPVLDGYLENRTTDIGNVTSQIPFLRPKWNVINVDAEFATLKETSATRTGNEESLSSTRIQSRSILKKHRFFEIIFFFFLNHRANKFYSTSFPRAIFSRLVQAKKR